jgi:hypothetical protein
VNATHISIPTAGRAEFVVSAPAPSVKAAQFVTRNINTGPDGDNDPARPLAKIQLADFAGGRAAHGLDEGLPRAVGPAAPQRFEGLANAQVSAKRTLCFSEVLSDASNPLSPTDFYITVDGATPTLFDPNNSRYCHDARIGGRLDDREPHG